MSNAVGPTEGKREKEKLKRAAVPSYCPVPNPDCDSGVPQPRRGRLESSQLLLLLRDPRACHRPSLGKVLQEENVSLSHCSWVSPSFQPPFRKGSWSEKVSYVPLFTLLGAQSGSLLGQRPPPRTRVAGQPHPTAAYPLPAPTSASPGSGVRCPAGDEIS